MKKLLILFSVLFALGAAAQSTTITSTIIDPLGNSWGYGTVTAVFQGSPGASHTPVWSGGAFNPIPPTVTLDSTGHFTMTLPSTNFITPSGGTWIFSVCPNSSQPCAVLPTPVIGSTLDINPLITAAGGWPTQLVISTPIAKVYNVNQTFPPPLSQGGMLYDTTTQSMLVYTSTGWQPFATVGSGVPILSNPSGNQTITQPINTIFNFIVSGTGGVDINGVPIITGAGGVVPIASGGSGQTTGISALNALGAGPGTTPFAVGYPLTAPSVNSIYHVNPAMGDPITSIQAAWTACGNDCIVKMDAGTYTSTSSTPLQITYPTQKLMGDGSGTVVVNFSGTTFLYVGEAGANFSATAAPSISGFTLNCTNSAPVCITGGPSIGMQMYDLRVVGPGGPSSNSSSAGTCASFNNNAFWMERWTVDIECGGFAIDAHFTTPTGSGTNSYGYGDLKLRGNPVGAQLLVDSGAKLYNLVEFNLQANSGSVATTTATASSGATTLTVSSATGIFAGMTVEATGVPAGVAVASNYVTGSTSVPITSATTAPLSATSVTFVTVLVEASGYVGGGNGGNIVGEGSSVLGDVLSGGQVNLCASVGNYPNSALVQTPITSGSSGLVPWSLKICDNTALLSMATGVGTVTNSEGHTAQIIPETTPATSQNGSRVSSGWLYDTSTGIYDPYFALDSTYNGSFDIYAVPFNSYIGNVTLAARVDAQGNAFFSGLIKGSQLQTTQTPTASATASNYSVPIVLNGTTYYMRLSTTP